MKEDLVVYTALREHILHKEDEITNEIIYMYVTYFALLSVGSIWNNWISLISFIDLIVFQSMINSSQWAIIKASLYIRIFFEKQYDGIHWELLHEDDYYQSVHSPINRNIGWYFRKFVTSFLSLISFLSILFSVLCQVNYDFYNLTPNSILQIILALILCIFTIYVNILYLNVQNNNSPAAVDLKKAIENFYNNIKY